MYSLGSHEVLKVFELETHAPSQPSTSYDSNIANSAKGLVGGPTIGFPFQSLSGRSPVHNGRSMAVCFTCTSLPEGKVKSRLNLCVMVKPDIRSLYLLLVELETNLIAIEINVISDLEGSANP